jgi:AcrR family transcriptional regulator
MLFMEGSIDAVTLEAVADRAGVSLKTVVRQFKSKDALLLECAKSGPAIEEKKRTVSAGDVEGVVRVLSGRYEAMLDFVPGMFALEDRIPEVALARRSAIESHLGWLADAFSPWLRVRGAVRLRRLHALFGATELQVWWMWRRRVGLGRGAARDALAETLTALVAHWERHDRQAHDKHEHHRDRRER